MPVRLELRHYKINAIAGTPGGCQDPAMLRKDRAHTQEIYSSSVHAPTEGTEILAKFCASRSGGVSGLPEAVGRLVAKAAAKAAILGDSWEAVVGSGGACWGPWLNPSQIVPPPSACKKGCKGSVKLVSLHLASKPIFQKPKPHSTLRNRMLRTKQNCLERTGRKCREGSAQECR